MKIVVSNRVFFIHKTEMSFSYVFDEKKSEGK